jgi:hypothetical protein
VEIWTTGAVIPVAVCCPDSNVRLTPAAFSAPSAAPAGRANFCPPPRGSVITKLPFSNPRSGALSVVPPKGTGMLGSGIDPIWGSPGIGTGTATEFGVFVGKVTARPGTLNLAIERLDDFSMLPSGWRIAVAVEWKPEKDRRVPTVRALALASPVAVTVPSSL